MNCASGARLITRINLYSYMTWSRTVRAIASLFIIASSPVISQGKDFDWTVRGTVSESTAGRQSEFKYTARFTSVKYSITLHDSQGKLVSTAAYDGQDLIVLSAETAATIGSDTVTHATLAATPYPFNAPDALQLAWFSLVADEYSISAASPKMTNGLVFSTMLMERALNWYAFGLTNLVFDKTTERLTGFVQRSPATLLIDEASLISMGIPTKDMNLMPKAPNGKFVANLGQPGATGFDAVIYESKGRRDGAPFPKEALANLFHAPTSDGKQPLLKEMRLQVAEVAAGGEEIKMPKVPARVLITDFRVEGVQGRPASYALFNQDWPLRSSTQFRQMQAKHQYETKAQPSSSPSRSLVPIVFIGVMASLPIFILLTLRRLKEHKQTKTKMT